MNNDTLSLRSVIRHGIRWGWYDFANSGYYVVFVALSFPLFLREHVFSGSKIFEAQWGIAQGAAVIISVLLSVSLSRFTDRRQPSRYWCLAKYAFGIPALLSFAFALLIGVSAGQFAFLAGFGLIHGIYLASLIFYDASLLDVSTGKTRIEISGWAWGWGYLGGVICLVGLKLLEPHVGYLSAGYFAAASGFFLAFSAIAIATFKKEFHPQPDASQPLQSAESDNKKEISSISTSSLAIMLLCMVLIMDGIAVFIGFMSLYWHSEHFSDGQIINLILCLQILSFPFSGLMSMLVRKGVSLFLIVCGVLWCVAGAVAVLMPTFTGALAAVILVSTVLGASQAVLRTIFSEIVTPQRRLFGFSIFALVEEGAAFIGPVLAGLAITVFGFKVVLAISALSILVGSVGLARVTDLTGAYASQTK